METNLDCLDTKDKISHVFFERQFTLTQSNHVVQTKWQ